MKNTNIQWCHSTINPVMGCDGCELWPSRAKIVSALITSICSGHSANRGVLLLPTIRKTVAAAVGARSTSAIYQDRDRIAGTIGAKLALSQTERNGLVDVIRGACKCYAGLLGTMRSWHKGHARRFDTPQRFAGRMAEAAGWAAPTQAERASKPWLKNAPRMIFISDMGDALSTNVSFEYLKKETIDSVTSAEGQQHLWLWLTKRPGRMAEFGRWLTKQGCAWPDNLVAMTTVTSPASAGRVDQLRKVPSKYKALSCEPVFAELTLNLTGIDWVIMGGGSDVLAEPFHIEWALSLRDQCRQAGAAFFLKQLGRVPMFEGKRMKLEDGHGGDWDQWPSAWRTRELPAAFSAKSDRPRLIGSQVKLLLPEKSAPQPRLRRSPKH